MMFRRRSHRAGCLRRRRAVARPQPGRRVATAPTVQLDPRSHRFADHRGGRARIVADHPRRGGAADGADERADTRASVLVAVPDRRRRVAKKTQ